MVRDFKLIPNYIYLYHTDEYLLIPEYPDSLSDNLSSTFSNQYALSRTAPIYTYSYSGPRTVQITLSLHRDMLDDMNLEASNMKLDIGDDYVDTLIARLQAIALPAYNSANKSVNPPMVALKLGSDIFIKGVVTSGISLNYNKPILANGKYALCSVVFTISEVEPFDAESIGKLGSFRGITQQFKKEIYIKG